MPDPNVLHPNQLEFYRAVPGNFQPYSAPRDFAQLQRDLNVAHDHLKMQVRVNGELTRRQLSMEDDLRWERRFRLGLFGAILVALVKAFLVR